LIDSNVNEKYCPLCKKIFYPEEGTVKKTFCGEEKLCAPPEESYEDSDCEIYYFCSEKCAQSFEKATPICIYMPKWKKLMGKIEKVSSSSGVKGTRPHQLYQSCKKQL